MTLTGQIQDADWDVAVDTFDDGTGGFGCNVRVGHRQQDGRFERSFSLATACPTEHEAVLAGLREGMIWIGQKMAGTFSIA